MKYEDVYREMSDELVIMLGADKMALNFYVAAKSKSFEMRSNETAASLMNYVCLQIVEKNLDALVRHMGVKRGGTFYFIGLDHRDLAKVMPNCIGAIWPHVNIMLHADMYEMFPESFFKTKLENVQLMQSPRATFNQFLNWYDEMKTVNVVAAEKQISFALAVRAMSRLASMLPDWADKPQVWTDDGRSLADSLDDLRDRLKAGLPLRGRVDALPL